MQSSTRRTLTAIGALIVLASLISCKGAHSRGYETGDGIPAIPANMTNSN